MTPKSIVPFFAKTSELPALIGPSVMFYQSSLLRICFFQQSKLCFSLFTQLEMPSLSCQGPHTLNTLGNMKAVRVHAAERRPTRVPVKYLCLLSHKGTVHFLKEFIWETGGVGGRGEEKHIKSHCVCCLSLKLARTWAEFKRGLDGGKVSLQQPHASCGYSSIACL